MFWLIHLFSTNPQAFQKNPSRTKWPPHRELKPGWALTQLRSFTHGTSAYRACPKTAMWQIFHSHQCRVIKTLHHKMSLTCCASFFLFVTWLKNFFFNSFRLLFLISANCLSTCSVGRGKNPFSQVSSSVPLQSQLVGGERPDRGRGSSSSKLGRALRRRSVMPATSAQLTGPPKL